ncbi:hypothetical protein [Variovorax boronicumulans]|uniref:hypothetical protein n=1 Tax=Variovorax boronicumulans TaxID=436515 RepID=UPI00209C2CB7|nr:hypothetical protein [Variovorax boronicumulans]PBI89158.1 hypothetical protein BKP43_31600 [Variovorax boronicumulans]
MPAMTPDAHRSSPTFALHALAAAALAWAPPGHAAPPSTPPGDTDIDLLLFLLAALFWGVAHVWTLLVVWAEARASGVRAPARKEAAHGR